MENEIKLRDVFQASHKLVFSSKKNSKYCGEIFKE